MELQILQGYKEVAHTADWSLRVWAPTLVQLFETACRGMLDLAGIRTGQEGAGKRVFSLTATDSASLLVYFLNEILYLAEHDHMAPVTYFINLSNLVLTASFGCASILEMRKEIKAVTYHKVDIKKRSGLYRVTLVFDV